MKRLRTRPFPSRGPPVLTDEQRPAGGREAGDAAGQRHLRRRRPGRFPAALLERLPVGDEELRGHHVRPRGATVSGFWHWAVVNIPAERAPSCLPAPATEVRRGSRRAAVQLPNDATAR